MDQPKTIYEIRIKKEATYYIKSESEEFAIEKAEEWFDEMHPSKIETDIREESDFGLFEHLLGAYVEI